MKDLSCEKGPNDVTLSQKQKWQVMYGVFQTLKYCFRSGLIIIVSLVSMCHMHHNDNIVLFLLLYVRSLSVYVCVCMCVVRETLISSHIKEVNLTELLTCGSEQSALKDTLLDEDPAGRKAAVRCSGEGKRRCTTVDKMHWERQRRSDPSASWTGVLQYEASKDSVNFC